jgi:hypothetical protein
MPQTVISASCTRPSIRHGASAQQVADPARGGLGHQHGEERDHPEDRRAVDDDQQHQHQSARDEQQRAVDVAEHLDRVERVAGRARELHLQAVRIVADAVAQMLDGVSEEVRLTRPDGDVRREEEDVVFHRHRTAVEAMRAALAATPPDVPAFRAIDDAAGVAFAPFVRETMGLLRREPVLLARLDELGREMERAIADFLAERAGGGEQAQRDAALLAGAIAGTMRTARRQALGAGVHWDPGSFVRAWELLAPLAPEHGDGGADARDA